jgi:hypothetical protein
MGPMREATPATLHDRRHRLILLVILLLGVAVPGAGSAQESAAIRFVHLSPDTPLVDVLVSGRLTFRDVAFVERSEVVTVTAGQHEIRVFPHRPPRRTMAGAELAPTPAGTPLEPIVTILDFAPGSLTTLVLTGSYEPLVAEEWRGYLSIQVDPEDAEIRLDGPRGYHAVLQGDQFLVGLEPGPYRAEVRRPGYEPAEYETEIAAGTTSVVSISLQEADDDEAPGALLPPARSQSQATWRALELQPYTDGATPIAPPGSALVRFVHAAPTAPALDVEVAVEVDDENGDDAGDPERILVQALAYPNASGYEAVGTPPHGIEIRATGTASVLKAVSGLEFSPGTTYTVYVSADPISNQIWLVPVVEALVVQHLPRPEAPR